MLSNCPGQDKRKVKPEPIICPACGYEAEIFSDEIKGTCSKCRKVFYREVMPTCVDWCAGAKECLGQQAYDRHMASKTFLLKDKLLLALKEHFGDDIKRINHAQRVLEYAQTILREEGGDWQIVVPAAILHDVGIKVAEEKYGSGAGHLQEREGPAVARKILVKLGFKPKETEEICQIIAHHHSPGKINTVNFKVLYDADWLVNLKDEVSLTDKDKAFALIEKIFLTKTGKDIAAKQYL